MFGGMSKFGGERINVELLSVEKSEVSPPGAFTFKLRVDASEATPPLATFPASFVQTTAPPEV